MWKAEYDICRCLERDMVWLEIRDDSHLIQTTNDGHGSDCQNRFITNKSLRLISNHSHLGIVLINKALDYRPPVLI